MGIPTLTVSALPNHIFSVDSETHQHLNKWAHKVAIAYVKITSKRHPEFEEGRGLFSSPALGVQLEVRSQPKQRLHGVE